MDLAIETGDRRDWLSPSPPEPLHFDPALGAWILSRYRDVMAALREPRLWPEGARGEGKSKIPNEAEQARIRAEVMAALAPAKLAEWQALIDPLARSLVGSLALDRPVDLVRELAEPWALAVAVTVTGVEPRDGRRLADLARPVSAAAADPFDSVLRSRATVAGEELERCFQPGAIPMGAAAFVALSQTLPSVLANFWLALLRHPDQLALLRDRPDLMPRAVEELFRYAGLVRRVFRRTRENAVLNGVSLAKDERVILCVASAHRDPEQFSDPDRLDVTRPFTGHVALGAGLHTCVGAALIRMAATAATTAFVERCAEAELSGFVEWRGGDVFRTPAALFVRLGSREAE